MGDSAILLDLGRCLGCSACVVACAAGNELAEGASYISIREEIRGAGAALEGAFIHRRCFHCADAACVAVCPTGALTRRGGLTAVDVDACSGCGYCVEACPYGIPRLVDGRVAKCSGCADLVAAGAEPYCVQTCPARALRVGPREAMLQAAHERVAALRPRRPGAMLYGDAQLGGLGLLTVTPYDAASVGMPLAPRPTPATIRLWQDVVQPASAGLTGLALAVTAGAFALARRNHRRELEGAPDSPAPAAPAAPEPAASVPDSAAPGPDPAAPPAPGPKE